MTTIIIDLGSIPRITQKIHVSLLTLVGIASAIAAWAQTSGPGIGIPAQDITYITVGAAALVTLARLFRNTPQPAPRRPFAILTNWQKPSVSGDAPNVSGDTPPTP